MNRSVITSWALAVVAACSGGGSERRPTPRPRRRGKGHVHDRHDREEPRTRVLAARTGARLLRRLSAKAGKNIRVNWLTPPQEDGQVQAQRILQAVNDGADAILVSCSDAGRSPAPSTTP
jgi:ribose transport system substrate-binding protein